MVSMAGCRAGLTGHWHRASDSGLPTARGTALAPRRQWTGHRLSDVTQGTVSDSDAACLSPPQSIGAEAADRIGARPRGRGSRVATTSALCHWQ